MFRKLLCGLTVLGMVTALSLPAMAGDGTGSIQVTLSNGDVAVPDGSVTLYRVGSPDGEDYWLTEEFGGGVVRGEDSLSPALAAWLAGLAEEEGAELPLDEEGSAKFEGLPPGLYLLVQKRPSTGYHLMEPMLVQLPCEYQWNVQSFPRMEELILPVEIPQTGDLTPLLGAAGMILTGPALVILGFKRRKR